MTKAKASSQLKVNRYSREDIFVGLQMLGYHRDAERAVKAIRAMGAQAPAAETLYDWRKRHPDIHQQALAKLDEPLAEQSELLVRQATELELDLLGKIRDRIDEIDAKDLANTLRNVSTTKGITFERVVGPIRGRPNLVIEHREPTKLLEEMARIAEMVRPTVDSTAEEITDATTLEPGE